MTWDEYVSQSTKALNDQAIDERNARWDEINEILDKDREAWEAELESIQAEIDAESEEETIKGA